MQPPSPSTAILLFTRTPEAEARAKTFAAGLGRQFQRLMVRRFISHIRSIARKSGLPVIVVGSDRQQGCHFGERLAHALASVFAGGFEHVIAVGNDTLTLTANDLRHAAACLQKGRAVVAPTVRGGAYLIGLSRIHFEPDIFAGLAWKTDRLFDQLVGYARDKAGQVQILEQKSDINNPSDLPGALASLPSGSSLYRSLRSILAYFQPRPDSQLFIYSLEPDTLPFLRRGPPEGESEE